MSVPMRKDDPAYPMLQRGLDVQAGKITDPNWITPKTAHRDGCHICEDPEFALMGLPLCKPCPECSKTAMGSQGNDGHIPADDTVCSNCGYDLHEAEHGN